MCSWFVGRLWRGVGNWVGVVVSFGDQAEMLVLISVDVRRWFDAAGPRVGNC